MIKELKKVERLIGEQYENDFEYKQRAVKSVLYYSTDNGYYMTSYAIIKNKNKKLGYTSESTMMFRDGRVSMTIDKGRICKSRTESAIKYFDSVCQNAIDCVLDNQPQFAD